MTDGTNLAIRWGSQVAEAGYDLGGSATNCLADLGVHFTVPPDETVLTLNLLQAWIEADVRHHRALREAEWP